MATPISPWRIGIDVGGTFTDDVRDGVLSTHAAADQYGVVVIDDGRSIDDVATAALRSSVA